MHVTMKKLQVLLPAAERDHFLDNLGTIGVVHIEAHEGTDRSPDLEKIDSAIKRYRQVLDGLTTVSSGPPQARVSRSTIAAPTIADKYFSLISQKDDLQQKLTALKKDMTQLVSWGDFDPTTIDQLKKAGLIIRFYETAAKQFSRLDLSSIPAKVIRHGATVLFLVFEYDQEFQIDADEVFLPGKSLRSLRQTASEYEKEIIEIEKELQNLAYHRDSLEQEINTLDNDAQFETARLNLETTAGGAVLLLSGWFPASREKTVIDFLKTRTVWYELRTPQKDEQPPVQLQNSGYTSKFEPITSMFALPNYFELDPTPFFAPFFMFFYGMCLGDIGYGTIVVIAALIMLVKGPVKMRSISILGLFLGLATIISGFILNSFFGVSLFDTTGVKGLAGPGGPIPFLGSQVINGKTEFPMMTFAIYIGVVQMLLGMILQTVNRLRQSGFIYAIQPFCYIPITLASFIWLCKVNFLNMGIYTINSLHIGNTVAGLPNGLLFGLLAIGIIPFVFFNTPSMKIYWRPLKFLWDFYNFINSMVSYGLSYLRLFALGLAGSLLGNAFNQIAFMIITDSNGEIHPQNPAIIFTILIMIAGHALNFGLSALGAFVHTVRLTFVEFYGSLSFSGGGKPYNPFTGKTTTTT